MSEEQDLNSTCLRVFEKWVESLQSYSPGDVISLAASQYSGYSTNSPEQENQQVCLQVYLQAPPTLYLKEFVNSQVPYALALEVIRLLNRVAYGPLEIWTPEVIRELFGYTAWYGTETDEEFLEEFEGMNDEPFNPDDHQVLLPSRWMDRMADSGFMPVGFKTKMSQKVLRGFKTEAPSLQTDLVTAMQNLQSVLRTPPIHSSEESSQDRVEPAFVFLWDESNFLPDAMDDVLNYRFEGGESSEAQAVLEYKGHAQLDVCVTDILFIERQLRLQRAIGRLYDAMQAFVSAPV